METLIYILIGLVVVLIAAVGVLAVWLTKGRSKGTDSKDLLFLQNQIENLSRTMDEKMGASQKDMKEAVRYQFNESQKLIKDVNEQVTQHLMNVTKGVTEANESSKQVFTIADQLRNLEQVLKHQKQRGNLGEASLKLTLENILPPDAYELQHLFDGGDQVDAIIKTKEGIIPVDAKYSLDNYNRIVNEQDDERKQQLEKEFRNDLKKRIDETAKYIRTKEGTLPFAFMYIPAEGIYYDLLVNEVGSVRVNTRSLLDYAYKEKGVIIVSPTTFAAYLQSVLYGFKAFKIEESAKLIGKEVEKLERHLRAYDEYFKKVGKSLATTVNHYDAAQKQFRMIDKDVVKIEKLGDVKKEELGAQIEDLELEKPKTVDEK